MSSDTPFSRRRIAVGWKVFLASRAAKKGRFDQAIRLLDEAVEILPLPTVKVDRAMMLLRAERTREAHEAFDALRQEFKGSEKPSEQYLRHYCTAMLSLMQPGSGQWGYEAKQAKAIKCRWSLKTAFPLVTIDEIYDRIKPRR
jgi:hypothetical protein